MHSYHHKIFSGIYHTSTSQTKNKNPYRLNRAGLVSIDKRIWRIHQLLRSYTDRKWNQLVIFSDNGNLCIIWKQPSRCSRQTNGTHGRRGSLNHPSDQRAGYRTANWKLFKNYQQSTRLLSIVLLGSIAERRTLPNAIAAFITKERLHVKYFSSQKRQKAKNAQHIQDTNGQPTVKKNETRT